MKRTVILCVLLVLTAGVGLAQVPHKKTGLNASDRKRWFRVLHWGAEDPLSDNVGTFQNAGFTFYRLGEHRWLTEIVTESAAYQWSFVYAILTQNRSNWQVSKLLNFASYDVECRRRPKRSWSKEVVGVSSFDKRRKELKILTKGNGIATCGTEIKYRIRGGRAVVIAARGTGCCDAESTPDTWPRLPII